jgi:hypothetical protein
MGVCSVVMSESMSCETSTTRWMEQDPGSALLSRTSGNHMASSTYEIGNLIGLLSSSLYYWNPLLAYPLVYVRLMI